MRDLAALRAQAKDHAKQIEAVLWLSVDELAVRWGVSVATVRRIPRAALPYLDLGSGGIRSVSRRYSPDDVAAFEAKRDGTP